MITKEEYLKAKAIVEEYEREEFEEGTRQADWLTEEDEEEDNDECQFCGENNYLHHHLCIYADPLDYKNCGYA